MLPLTRRFTPRRSAQTKVVKRPSPLFLNADIQWRPLFKPRFPLHGFYPPFLAYHTLTFFSMKPLPQPQTRVRAANAGTAKNALQHARPTSASSNPLAVLPTGGIGGPLAAHGSNPTIGEGGDGHNMSSFPGGCPKKSPFREYILTNPCWNELSLGQACPSANGIFYLTPRRGPLVTFPMQ